MCSDGRLIYFRADRSNKFTNPLCLAQPCWCACNAWAVHASAPCSAIMQRVLGLKRVALRTVSASSAAPAPPCLPASTCAGLQPVAVHARAICTTAGASAKAPVTDENRKVRGHEKRYGGAHGFPDWIEKSVVSPALPDTPAAVPRVARIWRIASLHLVLPCQVGAWPVLQAGLRCNWSDSAVCGVLRRPLGAHVPYWPACGRVLVRGLA